jgi:aspartyl-tRNA(Asn)/glutamyl-tRNA(Gln) amidotransferase subunit A
MDIHTQRISALLEKIERENDRIGAFIEVYAEEAIAKAELLDAKVRRGGKPGRLAGKAVAIKNNIAYQGKRLTCGSKMLWDYLAPYHAAVVERIEAEDGIILGSVNLDEFACGSDTTKSAIMRTKNPLDTDYVPGGSSGGSAASVAAGFADISLGSDTGGSIRCPASFCGVVGMKPTYGLVSRYGLSDMAMSLDQIGPLATKVADARLMLSVIAGADGRDQTTASSPKNVALDSRGKPSIAIAKEFLEGADPRIADCFHSLAGKLADRGYAISEISIPELKHAIPIYYLTVFAEFSSAMQKYDGLRYGKHERELENFMEGVSELRGEKFGLEVKRRILLGTFITTKEYQDAWYGKTLKARAVLKKAMESALSRHDLLLGPTMGTLPWKIGEKMTDPLELYLADILTVPANLAGIPAGSVPFGRIGRFRPGMQVLGSRFSDAKVLALMGEIERLDSL